MVKNIPNLLSLLRLVLAPVLLVLGWFQVAPWFVVLLAMALITDPLDGFLARALNQQTAFGATLDSRADFALYMTLPLALWWYAPDQVGEEAGYAVAAVAAFAVPAGVGYFKFGRVPQYHTWGAKAMGWCLGAGVLIWLVYDAAGPLHFGVGVLVGSAIEEVLITWTLPRYTTGVPSLWHARRLHSTPDEQVT